MKRELKIKFSRQELSWVERTADIECARALNQFNNLVQLNYEKLTAKEREMVKNEIDEIIKLYTFLKVLRTKLELWDSRYDIDTEINQKVEEVGK